MKLTDTFVRSSATTLNLACLPLLLFRISFGALVFSAGPSWAALEASPDPRADVLRAAFDRNSPYYFDGTIYSQFLAKVRGLFNPVE